MNEHRSTWKGPGYYSVKFDYDAIWVKLESTLREGALLEAKDKGLYFPVHLSKKPRNFQEENDE